MSAASRGAPDGDPRAALSVAERQQRLELALELTRECRAVIARVVGSRLEVSVKPDRSLVTNADLAAERAFRERLHERWPEAGVIGEELEPANPDAPWQWVIDPVDGTAEFASGMPTWGTIIALRFRGLPVVSVLDHPRLDLCCHAVWGLGAFCNGAAVRVEDDSGRLADGAERIATPSRASYLRYGDDGERFDALVRAQPNFRVFHTCYTHVCAVTGGVDAAVEWKVRLWDLAATQLLVEEAGGAYRSLGEATAPDGGTLYSAVFGRPALVARIAEVLLGA